MKTYTVCFDHGAPTWDGSATLVTKDIKAETLEDAIKKPEKWLSRTLSTPVILEGL